MKYKCIFFDLDHTLWDFEKNSEETLHEIYDLHELKDKGIAEAIHFVQHYKTVNRELWQAYDLGQIDRKTLRNVRFNRVLFKCNIKDDELAKKLSDNYLEICPSKMKVFPFVHEVLGYLKEKYPMFLVTNGFETTQKLKIKASKIDHYFKDMITSERAGGQKPNAKIFRYALELATSKPHETIMIGDNWFADIMGAKKAGLDQVYFNPKGLKQKEKPVYEITCLSELKEIL